MDFGDAVRALKAGKLVARRGWNGKGMWLGLIHGNNSASDNRPWTFTNGAWDNYPCASFIAMKTADGVIVPWLASQTDVLAEDWEVVPNAS